MREAGGDDTQRWRVLERRQIYDDNDVSLDLAEVEPPGGGRVRRHVLRTGRVAVGMVLDEHERVLMNWRHQFITDAFGWELPAMPAEPDEHSAATAVRAVEAQTGWRPGSPMWHLLTFRPMAGLVDAPHELYLAEGAEPAPRPATDSGPLDPVKWVGLATVPSLVERGQITDAGTLVGLLYLLAQRAKRA